MLKQYESYLSRKYRKYFFNAVCFKRTLIRRFIIVKRFEYKKLFFYKKAWFGLFHKKWKRYKFFWKKWNTALMNKRRFFYIKRSRYALPRKKYYKYILKIKRWLFRRFRKRFLKKRWRKFKICVNSNFVWRVKKGKAKKVSLVKRKDKLKSLVFTSAKKEFMFHSLFKPYEPSFRRVFLYKNSDLYKKGFLNKGFFWFFKLKYFYRNIKYKEWFSKKNIFLKRKKGNIMSFLGFKKHQSLLMPKPFFFSSNKYNVIKHKRRKFISLNDKNNVFKCIFLKKTINNMFITLTDSECRPIFLASYGRAKIFTKKRRKSSEAFKDLTTFFIEKLKNFGFKKTRFKIFFQNKIKRFLRNIFFYTLKKKRFKIFSVTFVRIKCHNGLRKKKMRRV